MDKKDVVCIFNKILFSHNNEGNLAICDNIDLEDIMLDKSENNNTVSHVWNLKKTRPIPNTERDQIYGYRRAIG